MRVKFGVLSEGSPAISLPFVLQRGSRACDARAHMRGCFRFSFCTPLPATHAIFHLPTSLVTPLFLLSDSLMNTLLFSHRFSTWTVLFCACRSLFSITFSIHVCLLVLLFASLCVCIVFTFSDISFVCIGPLTERTAYDCNSTSLKEQRASENEKRKGITRSPASSLS